MPECAYCGDPFQPRPSRPESRFCSIAHYQAFRAYGPLTKPKARPCLHCGDKFTPRDDNPGGKFCSREHYQAHRRKPWPTFICANPECENEQKRRKCLFADGRWTGSYDWGQRFCSKECGYKCRKRRPINPSGWVTKDTGYVRVRVRGVKSAKFKHRMVMEQHLGRQLLRGETVHHKYGDRTDWKIEHLELWNSAHPAGQRVTDKVTFAIEMLKLYPEFARDTGYELTKLRQRRGDQA